MKDEPSSPVDEAHPSDPDAAARAAGFSAILAELAHTPDAELGRWAPPPREGDTLGRFVLHHELGRGGMGVVWEAEDPALARRVALKLVRTGTRASARGDDWLKREAEAVARLSHPNIVTLHDYGTSLAGPYLVFERLHGRTLDRALLDGPLPYARVLELAIEVAGALDHAHRSDVVHRDLKPGNVFMLEGGGVKVLDFGLASLLGQSGLGDAGTPAFMAPEQWRGELGDARTDLFALGVTLWNALTGKLPYPVKDDRSAAAEPGETPHLPRGAAPESFRRLVERCLDRAPKARPASAREVLEALERIRGEPERRAHQRTTSVLLLTALAGLGAAGWFWWASEPAPGDKLIGVVADVRNQSGNPALDDLSRLLTTSLEQSRRLTLLSRPRLASMAREAKLEQPERLDAPRARDLARLGHARVLLLPEARGEGGRLVLSARAVDPDDEHLLFERSATLAGPAEVPGAVDQLAEALRRKLNERREDLASGKIQLASAISPNLDAARAYFQGIDCWTRPPDPAISTQATCPPYFESALAADPSFAMAHYWLARMTFLDGGTQEAAQPHVAAAMAAVGRLPAREALLVRSWAAHFAERDGEAMALLDEALGRFPDDTEALTQAATIRQRRHDGAGALPYLQRLAELEPEDGSAQIDVVEILVSLDRREPLQRMTERLERSPSSPNVERGLSYAYLGLGRPDDAVRRTRARYERLGTAEARHRLQVTLEAAVRFVEAEPLARAKLAEAPEKQFLAMNLAWNLTGQGRLREALRVLDEAESRTRPIQPWGLPLVRFMLLVGSGDGAATWRAAKQCFAVDPDQCASLAIPLALAGDLPHAAVLAARLPPGIPRDQYEALLAWRAGDDVRATAQLRRQLEAGQEPAEGMLPAYLLAEVALASGDPAGALAAIDRYRRLVGTGWWNAWARPRAALLAARAHLALDRREEARREIDGLLANLRRADPDLPLLLEARALRTGIGR